MQYSSFIIVMKCLSILKNLERTYHNMQELQKSEKNHKVRWKGKFKILEIPAPETEMVAGSTENHMICVIHVLNLKTGFAIFHIKKLYLLPGFHLYSSECACIHNIIHR